MKLVSAKVGPFRSINTAQVVPIDSEVTVLVGMNEAGKTVLLKALLKTNDATKKEEFDPVEDFPRKDLSSYLKTHAASPAVAVSNTYRLTESEIASIKSSAHVELRPNFEFTVNHNYDNTKTVSLSVDETPALNALASTAGLSSGVKAAISNAKTLRSIPELLGAIELTETEKAFLVAVQVRIAATKWANVIEYEVWAKLSGRMPKFLYFSDYDLLPGKINLADLAERVTNAKADPPNAHKQLHPSHQSLLALLRMADVDLSDFSGSVGFDTMKAKIEAVSIRLTDQVLEFWKQNEDLDVEVAISADTTDEAPFNNGPNLYLRIKNRRHRGVSTSFDQRSRGFIWFFSFLVWFDSVQHQLDPSGKVSTNDLILLLDEPGLALHAMAQADFLRYIDELAKAHQIIYTTHSPFMVNSDRLQQVRIVEDQAKVGTVISENLTASNERTIFPLQAALGWTIAQNLFISKRNLIVEGPSELTYLQIMSALVEEQGGKGLRDDVTIVPVGGIGNVVTFVSLLGAHGLKVVVLHDYGGSKDQKLEDLVKRKLLSQKAVFNVSQFRNLAKIGNDNEASDVEDLFNPTLYLDYFNKTFAKQLSGASIKEIDLPKGDRVVARIEQFLAGKGICIRPSGGFNHYAVAAKFATQPPMKIDADTITRFNALFEAVNSAF